MLQYSPCSWSFITWRKPIVFTRGHILLKKVPYEEMKSLNIIVVNWTVFPYLTEKSQKSTFNILLFTDKINRGYPSGMPHDQLKNKFFIQNRKGCTRLQAYELHRSQI